MDTSRRRFLELGAAGFSAALAAPRHLIAYARAKNVRFKVGVPDWSLGSSAKVEAVALAKKIGFDGVQISLGTARMDAPDPERIPAADPAIQKAYLDESRRLDLPIPSCRIELLHRNFLVKGDPLAKRWIAEGIPIAKSLGLKVILLPFFGEGAIKTPAEMDAVGDVLRELAPAAEKAGLVLGLEDTISARDNVRIVERAKSPAVLTYYDIGNSTNNGFNAVEEIRWLGRARICEVHLKDNPNYLGEGKIDLFAVVDALADIGFDRWAQLETSNPSKNVEADMRRNLDYTRGIMKKVEGQSA